VPFPYPGWQNVPNSRKVMRNTILTFEEFEEIALDKFIKI
jgi:hypothetical protein